jgi:hypothetical protein
MGEGASCWYKYKSMGRRRAAGTNPWGRGRAPGTDSWGRGRAPGRTCRMRRAPRRNQWGGERVQAPATYFGRGRASYTNRLGVGASPCPGCVSGSKEGGREGTRREGGGGARSSDEGRKKGGERERRLGIHICLRNLKNAEAHASHLLQPILWTFHILGEYSLAGAMSFHLLPTKHGKKENGVAPFQPVLEPNTP